MVLMYCFYFLSFPFSLLVFIFLNVFIVPGVSVLWLESGVLPIGHCFCSGLDRAYLESVLLADLGLL